jgi:hypothetical protein
VIEAVSKCGMGALLIASAPVGGDLSAWGQWGLAWPPEGVPMSLRTRAKTRETPGIAEEGGRP